MGGTDKDDFEIEGVRVLTFAKKSPNYRDAYGHGTRRDDVGDQVQGRRGIRGDGDGSRMGRRRWSGTVQAVEVTVTSLDEPGEETFTQLQVQVGRSPEAVLEDEDGPKKPKWQWSRGSSADGPWTDIERSNDGIP